MTQKRDLQPKDKAELLRAAGRGAERRAGGMKAGSPLHPSRINTFSPPTPFPKPSKSLGVSRGDAGCLRDPQAPASLGTGMVQPWDPRRAPAKLRGSGAGPGPCNASFKELLGVHLPESSQSKNPRIDSLRRGFLGGGKAEQLAHRAHAGRSTASLAVQQAALFPSPRCVTARDGLSSAR